MATPTVMRHPVLTLLAGALALGALAPRPVAALDVDTFTTAQATLTNTGSSTTTGGPGEILGGNRGLVVTRWSGAGNVTVGVSGGSLAFSGGAPGEAVVTWDGDTDPLTLSPTGLGGMNLTASGDAFRLTVPSAAAGTQLTLTVYSTSSDVSVYGLVLPAIASSTDIDVPFLSFVKTSGPSGASFTSVGAITLTVRGNGASLSLDRVQVVSSTATVTASLTDNVSSAVPGDTLNYTATIGNTGPGAAAGVTLTNPLDAATTLVPGSVEVSPIAFDDQYPHVVAGMPSFSVFAPGVLANDVDGNSDPLVVAPAGARPTSQGGSVDVNADGSFNYVPPPVFRGLDTFTYRADDGHGIPGPGLVTMHVECGPINVSPTTLAAATKNSPYGPVTFTTIGAIGTVTWSLVGTLPTGMNFSAAGLLDGTPTQEGSFPLTFVATDSLGCSGSQAITLGVNSAPVITSANNATFTVGTFGSFTVTTTGFPPPSIARGGVALPGGVTFNDNGDGTGTLSGTPDPGTGGTYALTFTATNLVGSTPPQSFTLTVRQAPAIISANATTFTVGTPGTFIVTTTGFPVPSIARGGVALPANVTFLDNGDGTGTLSGTPQVGTGGTYALTFTATNVAGSSGPQSFTLTVNEAPKITTAATATFAPGKTGQTFTIDTTGFPRNPGMVITRTGTLPLNVTFTDNNNGTATIAGTPAAGTQAASPYSWVVTASNGVSPDDVQNPFLFNVTCPVITVSGAASLGLTFNTAMSASTFTQSGGNGTITWSATGLPAGVSIGPANGQVTGTPTLTGTFSAVVTAKDAGDCTGTKSVTVTVAPVAVADAYGTVNALVDNTQAYVTGGTTATPATPSVALAGTIIANDLPSGPGNVTAVAGTFATSAGGSVTIAADGTFLYTPPQRSGLAAITLDTFTYTVQSNTGGTPTPATSAAASVTLTLANRVWYVLNNGAGGNGQSQSPFLTLAQAQGASTINDHIFVYRGSGTTTNLSNGILLKGGQRLIGQGIALVVNGFTLVAATSNPLISNGAGIGVTLADGNTIDGITVSSPTGVGISGSGVNTLIVGSATTISGAGGGAFALSGAGNGAIAFGAAVTNSANRSISIQNRTGSTVTISGAITDTGAGVFLNSNSGSTITLTGGLNLSTGTNPAFTATGGGTVIATQNNTSIVNTLATTTGVALNVAGTTIGAGGLTFRSIASNGASSGIILNNTGGTAGLTVTGNGGSCTSAGTCTGGAIQNATAAGILLTSTTSPSFDRMFIQNTARSGISGTQVVNVTITNCRINNTGTSFPSNADDDSNIGFGFQAATTENNLSGVVTITGNTLTNAMEHGIDIQNFAGTITDANISNNILTSSTSSGTTHGSAIRLLGSGHAGGVSSITKALINANTITNFPGGAGITAQYGNPVIGGPAGVWGTPGSATNQIKITGNFINGQSAANPVGANAILMTLTGAGQANWLADSNGTVGNPISNIAGTEIGVTVRGANAVATCDITNNHITGIVSVNAQAIVFAADFHTLTSDAPQLKGTISGNVITGQDGEGIQVLATAGSTAHIDATVTNNSITAPNCGGCNRFGMTAQVGSSSANTTGAPSMCLDMRNNSVAGSGVNTGIGIRKKTAAYVFNIEGFVGGGDPTSFLNSANPSGGGVTMISQTTGFGNCSSAP
jgi:uncharacterized repeat protein (TIGR01451 family)